MSRKWTLPSGKLSVVKFIFLSKEFKRSCINLISFCFAKSEVSSTYCMYTFIKDLSTKSLTIMFSNSFMITFTITGPKGDLIDTQSICL